MFQWYRKSAICYIYLADVTAEDDPFDDQSEFRRSRWFGRGWTLQELLAPMKLAFFDKAWIELAIGRLTRSMSPRLDDNYRDPLLFYLLSDITNIPEKALRTGDFSQFCAAARLAWAADRSTTRIEDRAYSLLGLLEVHMPLLYGEGDRAFQRLQEEVIKSRDDDSLLAWGYRLTSKANSTTNIGSVLAQSPSDFRHCHNFQRLESEENGSDTSPTISHSAMTNIGMQMAISVRSVDYRNSAFIAILRGRIVLDRHGFDGPVSHLVVPLVRSKGGNKNHFSRAPGSPPFLISRAKVFSILRGSRFFAILGRVPLLWKLLVTKPIQTPIYLRQQPTTAPPRIPSVLWQKRRNEYETMNLHINEVTSMGYKVASFYPPWITRKPGNNSLVLRLDSRSTKFIIVFSKTIKSLPNDVLFAVCIGSEARGIARVDHGSALEYLIEQSRNLQVNTAHHTMNKNELQLEEKCDDGRCVQKISFQYIFGDVRIKCSVNHMGDGANGTDSEGEINHHYTEDESFNDSLAATKEGIGVAL